MCLFGAMAFYALMLLDEKYYATKSYESEGSEGSLESIITITTVELNETTVMSEDTQTWSNTTMVREVTEYVEREFDTTVHYPAENGFAFARRWSWGMDYSKMIYDQYMVSRSGYSSDNWNYDYGNYCNSTTFPYHDWSSATNKYVGWSVCLNSNSWGLQGSLTSADYQYVYTAFVH